LANATDGPLFLFRFPEGNLCQKAILQQFDLLRNCSSDGGKDAQGHFCQGIETNSHCGLESTKSGTKSTTLLLHAMALLSQAGMPSPDRA